MHRDEQEGQRDGRLRGGIAQAARIGLDEVAHLHRPVEVVAYFLAVLELARWGLVSAVQDDPSAPIVITRAAEGAEAPLVSEWDR